MFALPRSIQEAPVSTTVRTLVESDTDRLAAEPSVPMDASPSRNTISNFFPVLLQSMAMMLLIVPLAGLVVGPSTTAWVVAITSPDENVSAECVSVTSMTWVLKLLILGMTYLCCAELCVLKIVAVC